MEVVPAGSACPFSVGSEVGVDDRGVDGELHEEFALPLLGGCLGGDDECLLGQSLVEPGLQDDPCL